MITEKVVLIEVASSSAVSADCRALVPAAVMRATESVWAPLRRTADPSAEHGHWNWSLKSRMLTLAGVRCLGIETDGAMQGLLLLREDERVARCPPDKGRPLVYVEYVEAAPWNSRAMTANPRYRLVGQCLMAAAVEVSLELGYDGRVGLHSLPQSERFYGQVCGMRAWGKDSAYHGLTYFEFTAEGSAAFRGRSDG